MYVTSTEVKNNLGKYLERCQDEQIIITKHGKKYAVLLSYPNDETILMSSDSKLVYGTNPTRKQFTSYKEFLQFTKQSEQRFELIDGRVYLLASPGYTHQDILGKLYIRFWNYFNGHETCGPFLSPFDIELLRQPIKEHRQLNESDINVVQPDLVVLCDYKNDIDENDRYKGTPTLVVEILSDSSRGKDQVKKLDLYMESGINEYWLVDPIQKTITVHMFSQYDIVRSIQYSDGQNAISGHFKGLNMETSSIFTFT